MSQGKRYKFVGSTFQVSTGVTGTSPSPAISAISLTNPAIVTAAGHGLVTGDVGKIYDVLGATQFNGNLYPIDDATSNDVALANENNTAGAVYTSGGHIDKVAFTQFCELTGANRQGGGADQEEVTTICSNGKEFEQGFSDAGTLQLDFNFAPKEAVQAALLAAEISGEKMAFKLTMPNSGGIVILIGTVQTTSFNGAVGQSVWKGSASIKLSGPMFVL